MKTSAKLGPSHKGTLVRWNAHSTFGPRKFVTEPSYIAENDKAALVKIGYVLIPLKAGTLWMLLREISDLQVSAGVHDEVTCGAYFRGRQERIVVGVAGKHSGDLRHDVLVFEHEDRLLLDVLRLARFAAKRHSRPFSLWQTSDWLAEDARQLSVVFGMKEYAVDEFRDSFMAH